MNELLQGSLGFLSVADVLALLAGRRASGALQVRSGPSDATLFLLDGKLIGAESNPPRPSVKARDLALDALLWESGSFSFSAEKKPSAPEAPIAIEPLIDEASGKREQWKRYRQVLPDDSAVLRAVDNPEAQEKITLSREQWKVLVRVNGQRTVGELLREGDEDPLAVMKVLGDLLTNRLVEVAETRRTPKAPPDTRPFAVPAEVLAADARAAATPSPVPEKTVMAMKVPPPTGAQADLTIACLTMDAPGDQMFPLVESEYSIGRDSQNMIQLQDTSVSSKHARVLRSAEGFVLEDLNSRNGTFVNGERVQKKLLRENDRIRFGKVQLIYNIACDKPGVAPSTVFQQRPS